MKVEDVIKPEICNWRRVSNVKFFYAIYPNGDFFQGSGNGKPIMFKTKKGLMQNIQWQVSNIWSDYKNELEDVSSENELLEKYTNLLTIKEIR